jgi:uncharacterized protein YigE (DUF2233 family)
MCLFDSHPRVDIVNLCYHFMSENSIGIFPDGIVVFAISKAKVNFYDFAMYFSQIGCKQALYLYGYVSRTYLPSINWIQTDGDFGVMIAVTEPMS